MEKKEVFGELFRGGTPVTGSLARNATLGGNQLSPAQVNFIQEKVLPAVQDKMDLSKDEIERNVLEAIRLESSIADKRFHVVKVVVYTVGVGFILGYLFSSE